MSHETQQWQMTNKSGQGELFGRYRLRGIIGQGGMGRLYVAEQIGIEGFSKVVALKRILPHLADSQHFRAMFLNEARVAARLEHPNIVATFELGEVEGNYFISMEYLSGEDLATVLTRCQTVAPMPLEIAAALAQQSANGLHYAHEMRDPSGGAVKLVHRDVSPLNIFVTYYGMVKLLDFGIVKGATEGARTVPGVFKGKYAYCAPEQLEGGTIDRQTDVFCLGIVLWECLTGQRLFLRNNDALTIDAVRGEKIEPPSVLRKDVPPELDQIVLHALCRDRAARFQTAHALSEALDRFLLKRENRPTSKSIGLWMESLFGSQRATLKKAIAQGSEVEAALKLLPTLDEGRPVTTESVAGPAPVRTAAQPRMLWSNKKPGAPGPETRTGSLASTAAHMRAPAQPLGGAGGGLSAAPVASATGGSIGGPIGASLGASLGATVPPLRGTESSVADRAFPLESPFSSAVAHLDAIRSVVQPIPTNGGSVAGPASRGKVWLMVGAGALVLAVAAFVVRSQLHPTPGAAGQAAVVTTGSLELRSEPPGAQIFVDGDPSGLTTPATLTGLRPGRSVEIRLDKVGYSPVTERIDVKTAEARSRSFRLVEAMGTVAFEGLPTGAVIYANDTMVEGRGPLSLPIGKQRIRVETSAGVLFSQTIDVVAGQQSVRMPGAKRGGVR